MIGGITIKIYNLVLNDFLFDSRVHKFSHTLGKHHDVTVIAIEKNKAPIFEAKEKYNVQRIRLRSLKYKTNILTLILKYLEFIIKSVPIMKNGTVIHCNDTGAFLIGVLIKKFFNKKIKIIYDAHELESERNGLTFFKKKATYLLEKLLIKKADNFITVSESIGEWYKKEFGVNYEIILNVPNKNDLNVKSNYLKEKFNIKSGSVFIYQGGLTQGRYIEEILNAFKTNKTNSIVFLGYGPLTDLVKSGMTNHNNIFYHDPVPYESLPIITSSADVGICMIEPICLSYEYALPNKFFEYLQSGLPVLTNDLVEVRKIIKEKNIGWTYNIENIQEIINNFKTDLIDHKDINELVECYHWENEEKKILKIYQELNI